MCGLSGMLIDEDLMGSELEQLKRKFDISSDNITHRGPDCTNTVESEPHGLYLKFNRLAIMDPSSSGDQPFKAEYEGHTVYLVCNGEIYDYADICDKHKLKLRSKSDCETIMAYYMKYRDSEDWIYCMLNEFNSEHAFFLIDIDNSSKSYKAYFATDRFGIRPMFISHDKHGYYFSSELQGMPNIKDPDAKVFRMSSRSYMTLNSSKEIIKVHKYYDDELFSNNYVKFSSNTVHIGKRTFPLTRAERRMSNQARIKHRFQKAVIRRLVSDRKVGFLLSGGTDSSAIVGVAARHYKKHGVKMDTFSIGMEGGTDEIYARKVADFCGTNHTHITVTMEDFLAAIPDVIKAIGSFDRTTVRASTGQYLISKWISENTDIKVLLCGDGSDEVCGSYKYFHNAPNPTAFNLEVERLLRDIHFFDGLRADRCISHFGIEARFPFLDIEFVEEYLSNSPEDRMPIDGIEKFLLRQSLHSDIPDEKLIPDEVLWRSKEAFSDGVSSKEKSWYTIIQDYVKTLYTNDDLVNYQSLFSYLPPISLEALHFRLIFSETFGYNASVAQTVPYEWLPKWSGNVTDPSARILSVYTTI